MNNPLRYADPTGYTWLSHFSHWVGRKAEQALNVILDAAVVAIALPLDVAVTAVSTVVGVGKGIFTGDWSTLKNDVKIVGGLFTGSPGQILSRLTWELPQTTVGYLVSQYYNISGDVKDVSYFHGATVVDHYSPLGGAFTIGSYINAGNGSTKYDIMHEYGHYLQSQSVGPGYLFNFALPSLINANETPLGNNEHNAFRVEQDADIRARNYFGDSNWNYDAFPILGDPHNTDYTNKYSNWYNYMGSSLFEKMYKWLITTKN